MIILKNNMAIKTHSLPIRLARRAALGCCAVLINASIVAPTASGQIQVDDLTPANAFYEGIVDTNHMGLGANLWQNTSAATARHMLEDLLADGAAGYGEGASRSLLRTALLSGGIPPQAQDSREDEAFLAARLEAVLAVFGPYIYDQVQARSRLRTQSNAASTLAAERALLGGDIVSACAVSDRQTTQRKKPYWAKLRAFCHTLRDEFPAAELTADLLRRGEHEDAVFYTLLGNLTGSQIKPPKLRTLTSPLHVAMAQKVIDPAGFKKTDMKALPAAWAAQIATHPDTSGAVKLAAFFRAIRILSPEQIESILLSFSEDGLPDAAKVKTRTIWAPSYWGQVYRSLKSGTDAHTNAGLIKALLGKADKIDGFAALSGALVSDISLISSAVQAETDARMFARIAVANRDIGTLLALHQELGPDQNTRNRIALAADALGGGFLAGDLGVDIDARLSAGGSQKTRAVRDTYIAVALGARLDPKHAALISEHKKLRGRSLSASDRLVLKTQAREGAQAALAIQAALALGGKPLTAHNGDALSQLIFILNEAGMREQAQYLAAQDFILGKE
jgi:hypothetical protein